MLEARALGNCREPNDVSIIVTGIERHVINPVTISHCFFRVKHYSSFFFRMSSVSHEQSGQLTLAGKARSIQDYQLLSFELLKVPSLIHGKLRVIQ